MIFWKQGGLSWAVLLLFLWSLLLFCCSCFLYGVSSILLVWCLLSLGGGCVV